MDVNSPLNTPIAIERKTQALNPDEQLVRAQLLLSYPNEKLKVKQIQDNIFSV